MNCKEAVAALVASLESGQDMTEQQRGHIRTCARCRELLDSAKQFESLLEGNGIQTPPLDPIVSTAEDEVRRRRERRAIAVAIGILLILGAAAAWMLIAAGEAPPGEAFAVVGGALGIALLLLTPIFIIFFVVRRSVGGKARLYKRLGKGRQLSGVCLGLAEATKINVTAIRVAFLLLMFVEGAGCWLYLILDLAMPVHPEDRQYLWRFRVRRWMQRRLAHAANDVG
ncbi:MAG TPA: PspC domain-containing protein [Thermoanaerobaculia bacterium]|nr:PspC domain-containing protein [Thermoanaerobaculia bacterium]